MTAFQSSRSGKYSPYPDDHNESARRHDHTVFCNRAHTMRSVLFKFRVSVLGVTAAELNNQIPLSCGRWQLRWLFSVAFSITCSSSAHSTFLLLEF